MNKPSKVLVNNNQEFTIEEETINDLDILKQSASDYHLLHKQKSIRATVIASDFNDKTYSIRINSNTYEVKIQTLLDDLIKKIGYSIGSAKIINSISAPMPGIIIGVNIKKDQKVKEGDTLLILEAMKMENAILCPKDAKIKEVFVSIGETVDKNKLLITFD
jgi:biotin carboxyl carrier protein